MKLKNLEICLPVYNEEEVINDFTDDLFLWIKKDEIFKNFSDIKISYLNNGSTDQSLKYLEKIKKKYNNVKITSFAKNYGFFSSTSYLLHSSEGDLVVLIPSDGQIPFKSIRNGIDMTLKTQNTTFLIRESSVGSSKIITYMKNLLYKILKTISYDSIEGFFGMGVYTRENLSIVKNYQFSPFQIRIVIPYILDTFNIIKFKELKRKGGKTSFGFKLYLKETIKLVILSQKFPTYLSIGIFSIFSILSFSALPFVVLTKLIYPNLIHPGFATLIILMLLMMAVQGIFALSVLLEIKSRDGIYGLATTRRKRPLIIKRDE